MKVEICSSLSSKYLNDCLMFQARRTFYAKFQKNCGNDEVCPTHDHLDVLDDDDDGYGDIYQKRGFDLIGRCVKPNCRYLPPCLTKHCDLSLTLHKYHCHLDKQDEYDRWQSIQRKKKL